MPLVHRETVPEQGVEAVLLDVGESHVELIAPLGEDTPVGRFLAAKGPGLHHVAYQVADVSAALQQLREAGMRLIDETPRTGIRGSQVAFLHPKTTGGVLTELVTPVEVHLSPATPARRAAIGFQGGQVLSVRLSDEQLTSLRTTLREGRERWTRSRPPTARSSSTSARSSTCALSQTITASAFSSADVALYRRVRSLARPETAAVVRRFSRLGEHGGVWLAGGTSPRCSTLRGDAAGCARPWRSLRRMRISTAIKLVVRRPRPDLPELPAADADTHPALFPSAHAVTSFAAARAFGVPALWAARRADGAVAAVPRRALPVRHRRRRAARHRPGELGR